jgi:hypothetical protein
MGAVRRFCDRAMLLEHGRMVSSGEPEMVGNRYLDLNFSASARAAAEAGEPAGEEAEGSVHGDGRAVIEEAWVENAAGERPESIHNGERATFAMRVRFTADVEDPVFSVNMQNGARVPLFSASSGWETGGTGSFRAGEEVLWRVSFDNVLGPDRYSVTPSVALGGGATLAVRDRMFSVVVTRSAPTGALVDIPFDQRVERLAPVDVQQEIVR